MKALLATIAVATAVLFGAAPASADVFDICPFDNVGVVGADTSCQFAGNVKQAYYASGMASEVIAYSPITGMRYVMHCTYGYHATFATGGWAWATHCDGGNNAKVVIW